MSWYFIFSKPAYQELKSVIEKNVGLIEKWKRGGKDDKRRERMESEVKLDNAKLAAMKAYNMIFLSIVMIGVYQGLKYYYSDTVVATLPFVPFSMFQRLFQAGISSSDPRACGMVCQERNVCSFFLKTNYCILGWHIRPLLFGSASERHKGIWGVEPQGSR